MANIIARRHRHGRRWHSDTDRRFEIRAATNIVVVAIVVAIVVVVVVQIDTDGAATGIARRC
jgi:hypothetical protein